MGKHSAKATPQGKAAKGGASKASSRAKAGAPSADAARYARANGVDSYVKQRKKRGRLHVFKCFLVTVLVIVGACGAALAAYVYYINSSITRGVDEDLRETLVETKDPGDPFYMLLLGIDRDEDRAQSSEYGESYSAYRTDTIILARVDPRNKKLTLISIPRDTLVDMGVNGKQKINAAYTFGGAAYATEVVSEFAGVDISHYAEIDMDGFAEVVDAVGGVTVDLPVAVYDPDYTGLDLPAGEQHLDGHTAALLGRTRHAYDDYGGGDFYREANQRMLIGAVADKVLSSPATMIATVTTLAGYVTTDMDLSYILSLASSFTGMNIDEDIYSGQCPTTSEYVNDIWYELCNTTAWRQIMRRVDQGLPPYEDASQDFTAGVAGSVGISTTDDSSSSEGTSAEETSSITPEMSGTVQVLNGTQTAGVAGRTATTLANAGFTTYTGDAPQVYDATMIYYNGDGEAAAAGVAQTLGVDIVPQQNDGSWDTTVDVVVVLGLDWTESGQ